MEEHIAENDLYVILEQKEYDYELELCKKLGGNIESYKAKKLDAAQLKEIRKGLEQGIAVEEYADEAFPWYVMEVLRLFSI